MKYGWKAGSRTKGNLKTIVGRLEALRRKNAGLRPRDVVEDARSPKSPLHSHFEWDDTVAGERYRMAQAREMIASVVVIFEDAKGAPRTTRAFVHIDLDESMYESIEVVMQEPDMRGQLLGRAKSELAAFTRKYRDLVELAAVMEAASEVLRK